MGGKQVATRTGERAAKGATCTVGLGTPLAARDFVNRTGMLAVAFEILAAMHGDVHEELAATALDGAVNVFVHDIVGSMVFVPVLITLPSSSEHPAQTIALLQGKHKQLTNMLPKSPNH